MARKKASLLIQVMNLFNQLPELERNYFIEYARSQQPPRTSSKRASKKKVATAADDKEAEQPR